ncbi:MAG: HD domain-containing protein, partial [Campylobacterota bacterium]|nr:HD domain-containing protein [Campylobacterota bacterium]
ITFIPIKNIENNVVAYLVSYIDNYTIHNIYKHFYHKVVITFFIFLIIIYIIYKNKLQDILRLKKSKRITAELQKQIDAFDKNVIFSKTDLKGNITHVSEAFCKISGYKSSELIGRAHNIIRHTDMPKDAFKDLWDTLKSGRRWSGEVKNRKKNGDFYWVLSTIERDYNDKGKHIGYYAVRHIITAQKKVEELKIELEVINSNLEDEVSRRTSEIVTLNKEIQDTQKEVVFTMGAIGETRSKETGNHVKRVAEYSKMFALHYGLSAKEADMLKQASPMHDIGKVGIPDSILNKPGRFDEAEREIMNKHAQLGYDMLKHSDRPLLKMAATVAYEHHEKWDGTGYPNGLKGEDIHIYGRITSLADVFDALGSDRVYKKAWSDEKIFKLFKDEKGKHFDPKLVDIFFDNLDDFLAVRDSLKD